MMYQEIIVCDIIQNNVTLYHIISKCIILHYIMLRYTILYAVMSHKIARGYAVLYGSLLHPMVLYVLHPMLPLYVPGAYRMTLPFSKARLSICSNTLLSFLSQQCVYSKNEILGKL